VGLLLIQSYASVILESFEALIQKHLVITLFLPMLVGAAGNSSNQCAMVVVRGIATGEVSRDSVGRLIVREAGIGLSVGLTMMTVAYIRVWLFHSAEGNDAALAIGCSTFGLMLLATTLGTTIPLLLDCVGIDPAHAGPVVAVSVDLMGVLLLCLVCSWILPV
jgi:magnesium transporter